MITRTPTSSTSLDGALDLYFFDNNEDLDDKKKVIFAATYMRGDAGDWIQPYVTKYLGIDHNNYKEEYLNLHADAIDIVKDYPNFKKSLQQMFGIANKVPIAERAIQTIMQKRSIAEYIAEFRKYTI
ncbi:reverse transcriptase domain protein [Paraphaeosphaeria sporulosa]